MPDQISAGTGAAALLALLALAGSVRSQQADPSVDLHQQLRDSERGRAEVEAARRAAADRARAAAAEEHRLETARAATLARLHDAEAATQRTAEKLDDLGRRRRAVEAELKQRTDAMAQMLPLMERLSLCPTALLLTVPAEPEQAVRGLLVIEAVGRELEREAEGLRRQTKELERLAEAIEAATPDYRNSLRAQQELANTLDRDLAAASELRSEADSAAAEAARQVAAEVAKARSLRAALAELDRQNRAREAREARAAAEAQRMAVAHQPAAALAPPQQEVASRTGPAPAGPAPAAERAASVAPVVGTIVRPWGAPGEAGPAAGVTYHAAPAARVVAPCSGRVVFGGPFRSYGLIAIVDCGRGYHFVLAGLDRLDAAPGRAVAAGDPIGVMPGWEPGGAGVRPGLYVELRRDGEAVDPSPWLRPRS